MKKICLYCNWKVKPSRDGFYISAVHAAYLNAFVNSGLCEVILLSNISNSLVNHSDIFFEHEKVSLIRLPAFSSYSSAIKKIPNIFCGIYKAYKCADVFYLRTPEPFSWLFGLLNFFGQKDINYHVTSNPLSVIWKDQESSVLNRLVKCGIFYPEYIAIMISAFFNNISCNGPSAKEELPFFIRKRVKVLVESTKRKRDFYSLCAKDESYLNPDVIKMLVVTRIFPAKGLEVLLNAFSRISLYANKCELMIEGE